MKTALPTLCRVWSSSEPGSGSLYRTEFRNPLNKEKGLPDSGKSQDQDLWRENAQHSTSTTDYFKSGQLHTSFFLEQHETQEDNKGQQQSAPGRDL